MKKIFGYIISVVALLGSCTFCAEPDPEFTHSDCTISAIYCLPAITSVSTQVTGEINQETGEITFAIGKKVASYYKLDSLKLRANIGYDAYVTPSMYGIHDLNEPKTFTVTAKQTGESKTYTISAYYSRNL